MSYQEDISWLLLAPPEMDAHMSFVRQALALLDIIENALPSQEAEKIPQEKELMEKSRKKWEAHGFDVDDLLIRQEQELRGIHRVSLPLNARYSALTSATTRMESLIHFLNRARRRQAAEFIQKRAKRASAKDAVMFERTEKIVRSGTSGNYVRDVLKILAQEAEMDIGAHSGRETFCDLWLMRNAIVHGAGCVQDGKKEKETDAAERLGFSVTSKVTVSGEVFQMPLGAQIWIERDALNKPVERTLKFIEKVYKKHLLPGEDYDPLSAILNTKPRATK